MAARSWEERLLAWERREGLVWERREGLSCGAEVAVACGVSVLLPVLRATSSDFGVLTAVTGVVGVAVGINWAAGDGLVLPVGGVPCDLGGCWRALVRVVGRGLPLGTVVAVTMPRGNA